MGLLWTGWCWLVALLWLAVSRALGRALGAIPKLPPRGPADEARPRVSVVLAVRDEGDRIEQTVLRLLAQIGVELELVVVDDRSTDETPAILARLAERDSRLTMVRVEQLPPRWLGKCHALHLGAQRAQGDWLLFTDGDVWMASDVVARAVSAAVAANVEHVCLLPRLSHAERRSLLAEASLLAFGISLGKQFGRVNRDDPRAFGGIGAFNLVRTECYRSFGGHLPLRMEVADDPMLGLLVRTGGGRTRAFCATEEVECQWADSLPDMFKALEKNHFAMLRYRTGLALAAVALFGMIWLTPLVGLWTGGLAGIAAFLAFLTQILPAWRFARAVGSSKAAAILVPFVMPIIVGSLLHSMVRTLWRGGVQWRGTFYPLAELRAGCIPWSPRMRVDRPPPALARSPQPIA